MKKIEEIKSILENHRQDISEKYKVADNLPAFN